MDASTGCLSVVMPAYNEEQTIDEIIHRVLARTEVGEPTKPGKICRNSQITRESACSTRRSIKAKARR